MFKSVFAVLLGLSLGLVNALPTQEPDKGKNWVVIVAGSSGWYNYRHQVRGVHETDPSKSPYHVQTLHDPIVFLYNLHFDKIRHMLLKCAPKPSSNAVFLLPGRCLPCLSNRPQEWHPR